MKRIFLGVAAAALITVSACGTQEPTTEEPVAPPATADATADAAATPTPDATPDGTATPTATPTGTATPDATATPTPTPTPAAAPELPDNVEGFNRVSQRTDDGVRVGLYRSADLGAVVEIRIAQDTNARDMIADLGGVNPITIGDATCSTQGDTICAQEDGDTTVAIATKQLPASTVAELTTAVIEAD